MRAPDDLNVNNSLQFVNTVTSPTNELLSVQFTPGKSNGTNVVDSVIDKRSVQTVDVNIQTLTSSKSNGTMNDTYKEQSNFKIPVRVQGNTEEIKPIDSDVFVGVSPRKRSARFYLSGIVNKSTRSGTLRFIEMKNVKTTFLQLFYGKYIYSSSISAKLNVPEDCASLIESDAFWPSGVWCRRWLSNRDWQLRWNESPEDE